MERIIKFAPGFDKRNPNPSKNFGISSVQMFLVLKGSEGVVGLSVSTGWYLKKTEPWIDQCDKRMAGPSGYKVRTSGLFYCSPIPLSDDQKDNGRENCDWLGCTCYGDVAYTAADEPFEIFVSQGEDAFWKWMENYYQKTFNSNS